MEELLQRLREFSAARDWRRFHTPKALALSVSIEAGELLEVFQWKRDEAGLDKAEQSRAIDEAADVLIYVLLLLDQLGTDPLSACHDKISLNELRFPKEEVFGIAKPLNKDVET